MAASVVEGSMAAPTEETAIGGDGMVENGEGGSRVGKIRFLFYLYMQRVLGLGLDIQYSGSCIVYRGI